MRRDDQAERALEDMVVRRLRDQGLIRSSSGRRTTFTWAAILVTGASALLLVRPGPVPAAQRTYIVALYGEAAYLEPAPADRSRAGEYAAWARAHRAERDGAASVIGGDELEAPIAAFGDQKPSLLGFFTVRAANDQQAIALARSTPHLRHGGSVVVQRMSS